MAEIVENVEIDRDTIPAEDIVEQFNEKYNLLTETAVTLKQSYINKLSVNKSLCLGVSLQDHTIEVYELNNSSLSRMCHLEGHEKTITELVFHPKDDHLLFSTSLDGLVKLWDLRVNGGSVQEYQEGRECSMKPYECMDVSDLGNVFCCGSQLINEDSFIVFWDPRNPEPLGAYWESHTEDLTQVKFQPNTNTVLASGATDGLINIFNLLEQCEENALTYSMNVGNSVEKLTWLNKDQLSCITQSNDFQLWNTQTGDLVKEYSRNKIARSIKRSRDDECYVVDTFQLSQDSHCVLAGSYGGEGNTLRSLRLGERRLVPNTDFVDNKQVVRCCHYDTTVNLLFTTGESGFISVWGVGTEVEAPLSTRHASKCYDHRHKPY